MSMELLKNHLSSRRNPINFFHSSSNGIATAAAATAIFTIFFLGIPSASADSFVQLFQPQVYVGRNLLQAKKECPVDVQNWNYTIVTSQCKGPRYPANECCEALRDLACPYSAALNDLDNNCATTMFSYINLYGKYPPGLFANTCQDSERGLECTKAQMSSDASSSSTGAASAPTIAPSIFFLPVLFFIFLSLTSQL